MSHLIEDSLFYPEFSRGNATNPILNKNNCQEVADEKEQPYSAKNQKRVTHQKPLFNFITDKDTYTHKYQNFSLVLLRRRLPYENYRFQGIILFNDHKFSIRYKQKRIIFGKQWMKTRQQHPIKLAINFRTGQFELKWPQILNQNAHSILNSSIDIQKLIGHLFQQFIHFFDNQLIPVFKKICLFEHCVQNQLVENFQEKQETNSVAYEEDHLDKMEKYLYMSTTIDSFERDKQTFRRVQDKAVKQKQNIIKVQTNIDLSFSNLSKELNLFTQYTLQKARKKLANFGILSISQNRVLKECLNNDKSRVKNQNPYQFILNCIGIVKIENKKRFIGSGGSCNVFSTKMLFQYVFSEDPKYWLQVNKKLQNNIVEKTFVIKEPKTGNKQKIRHQIQIVKQMKGGFSIYLPKYYKVQSASAQPDKFRNEEILIIDYLRGQRLDVYLNLNRETLSFWTKIFLVRNIVNGLRFIAGYRIVHLDLKPTNIIVASELLTKLIDFSESYHPKLCKQNYLPGMTLPYSCPQIFSNGPINYDQKCDVFSLGVMMYELFFGRQMFELQKEQIQNCYKNKSYMQKIFLSPEQFEREQIGPIFTIIFQLTMRCLDPRPQNRPTINWISIIISQVLSYFRGK